MSSLAKAFGKNLKAAKEQAGLDGHKLAAKLGMSASFISMLERGERSPSLETVEKVAKFFKINALKMLGGAS